jgi:hypothetical protein
VAHLREWRQQFTKLESVDLRYDQQIIVNPDLRGATRQPILTQAAARAAMAAGVKPSALVSRSPTGTMAPHAVLVRPVRKPASQSSAVAQKWKMHGSLTSKIKPASIRHAEKQSPPHKRWAPVKHSAWKPRAQSTTTQPKTAKLQKPSPAIVKGQETH